MNPAFKDKAIVVSRLSFTRLEIPTAITKQIPITKNPRTKALPKPTTTLGEYLATEMKTTEGRITAIAYRCKNLKNLPIGR